MHNEATQNIIQQFLQFLTQRNLEELTHLFADHIDWYIPGDEAKAPWLGRRNSKADVKAFYELLWAHTEPISASIDNIINDGNHAVITGTFSTRMLQTDKVVDSPFSIHITVEHNLITRYLLFEDSYAVSVALTA